MMLWNLLKTTAMRSNPPFKTVYLLSWYESSHGFLTWHNTILKYGKNYPSITSYRIPFPFKDLTLFEFKTMKEEMEKCGIANHRWAPFRPTRLPARKTVQTRSNPHWRRQKSLVNAIVTGFRRIFPVRKVWFPSFPSIFDESTNIGRPVVTSIDKMRNASYQTVRKIVRFNNLEMDVEFCYVSKSWK